MDRIMYAEMVNELLENAQNELSDSDFELFLNRVGDMVSDYEY